MDIEQNICLFSRKHMDLTGIKEVVSFDDDQVTVSSDLGMISVEGRNLKIESFSTEKGELKINGEFDSFFYYSKKEQTEKQGFLSKLFK